MKCRSVCSSASKFVTNNTKALILFYSYVCTIADRHRQRTAECCHLKITLESGWVQRICNS